MLARAAFLKSLAATAASSLMCQQSRAVPYGQPIGLDVEVLDGPTFKLVAYRGRPLVMNIFATWCGPCMAEIPDILDVYRRYSDRVAFVFLNFAESDNTVRVFRKRFDVPFPIAMDRDGGFTQALERRPDRSISIPQTLFFNADGTLECYRNDMVPRDEWPRRLEQLLRAQATPTPSPQPQHPQFRIKASTTDAVAIP